MRTGCTADCSHTRVYSLCSLLAFSEFAFSTPWSGELDVLARLFSPSSRMRFVLGCAVWVRQSNDLLFCDVWLIWVSPT